jgi:hypothetical protein
MSGRKTDKSFVNALGLASVKLTAKKSSGTVAQISRIGRQKAGSMR